MRSVKGCFKRSIGHSSLKFQKLRTLVVENEAALNNQPLYLVMGVQSRTRFSLPEGFTKQWHKDCLLRLRETHRMKHKNQQTVYETIGDPLVEAIKRKRLGIQVLI